MTLGLFLLRTAQMGLTIDDMDGLEYGTIIDMMTESSNDECTYDYVASQEDFDAF